VNIAVTLPRILGTYSEQKRCPHTVTVGLVPTVGGASHILHRRESGVEAVTAGGTSTSLWVVTGGTRMGTGVSEGVGRSRPSGIARSPEREEPMVGVK